MQSSTLPIIASAEMLRLAVTFIVIWFIPMPVFFKVLFTILLDTLDYRIPKLITGDSKIGNTEVYKCMDKLGDFVCNLFLLAFISTDPVYTPFIPFLCLLILYRFIGQFVYFQTFTRKTLIVFPNWFPEVLLLISFLDYIGKPYAQHKTLYICLIIVVMILKVLFEYYMYSSKK